jgi:hypothetical protein
MYFHKDSCASLSRPMNQPYEEGMCDCGFAAAFKAEGVAEAALRDELAAEYEEAWIESTIAELEALGYEVKKVK